MKSKLKRGDMVIILAVLLLALGIFLIFSFGIFSSEGETVLLSYGGENKSFALADGTEFSFESNGYSLTMKIEGERAYIESSDCPDKTCVHSGKISRQGQMIACIPAGVTLRIEGKGDSYDFVAG